MADQVAPDRAQRRRAPARGQEVRKHRWRLTQVDGHTESVELRAPGDTALMAEMAEEGGDCGLALELLGSLGGYRITLRDALRDGEEKRRLEVAGGLGGSLFVGKMVLFLSSQKTSDTLPMFYFDLCS